MPYLAIDNFKYGMDRRRPQYAGIPGTLWDARNCVITRGGDIEGAKKWVSTYTLPEGDTFGLYVLNNTPYVFGHKAAGSVTMPGGVTYQRCDATGNMIGVLNVKAYDGKLYVVAEFTDGNIHHFYDGTEVTDWQGFASGVTDPYDKIAQRLATEISVSQYLTTSVSANEITVSSSDLGMYFDFVASASSGTGVSGSSPTLTATTTQSWAAGTKGTFSWTISLSSAPRGSTYSVPYIANYDEGEGAFDYLTLNALAWNTATATETGVASDIVAEINSGTWSSYHDFTATNTNNVITITHALPADTDDHRLIAHADNMDGPTGYFSGGADFTPKKVKMTVSAVSFDATDEWDFQTWVYTSTHTTTGTVGLLEYDNVKVAGASVAQGSGGLAVAQSRMWATSTSLLRYCKLNDPSDWTDSTASTGAGAINVSTQSEGAQNLVGLAKYEDKLAAFAENDIIIYTVDTDDDNIAVSNVIENIGTFAARSAVGYGNSDVYFLHRTGIRSIKSIDGLVATPRVADIGSPIDAFIQAQMRGESDYTLNRAVAAIEPIGGRYMLAIGQYVYVLSNFPENNIAAWTYLLPGFEISAFGASDTRLYARAGDTIYVYGGSDGNTYPDEDEAPVYIETPFTAANDPAGVKMLEGFDCGCQGDWEVDVMTDPSDPDKYFTVSAGVLNEPTYHGPAIKIPGKTSHVAFILRSSSAGKRTFSSLALHYSEENTR